MNCNSAHIRPTTTPAHGRRKHHVNLEQLTEIRTSIDNAITHLRRAAVDPGGAGRWACAGVDRPVPVDAKVEVQFRGGGRATGAAGQFAWLHDDHSSGDIVKYRVCE